MKRVEREKAQMTAAERDILVGLDQILRSEKVLKSIRPVVARVRARLAQETGALMAWEPIALTNYGGTLPDAIKSSWVFVLRAGTNTGAERHPNSHQRMMSFQGSGDMRIQEGTPKRENWHSNLLISDPSAGRNAKARKLALELVDQRSECAAGKEMDFDSAECLASTSHLERSRLGSSIIPHRTG